MSGKLFLVADNETVIIV